MIRVVDAIMGSGKSSAAITYMNEHPDKKFVYITPYLEEASRIAEACPHMRFHEPRRMAEFSGSKMLHTIDLISNDENVATTHQAFKSYPPELLELIREKHYTLIIDEDVEVLEALDEDPADIQMAADAGYIKDVGNGTFSLARDVYNGKAHRDLFRILKSRDIIKLTDEDYNTFFYWQLPPDLVTAFDDVFILTYLFKGQDMHCFLTMHNIPYSYAGIEVDSEGKYRFSENTDYVPAYVKHLKSMVHIIDKPTLNEVGDGFFDLSVSWFRRNSNDEVVKLKNNISNFFKHICPADSDDKMWSSFTEAESKLRGKGYSRGFVPFNAKATNKFKSKTSLAYCVNIFMNVGQKMFYENNGVEVDENLYALSAMVQWIWRSAIRDGHEIWLYVPSRRMRELLVDWINKLNPEDDNE